MHLGINYLKRKLTEWQCYENVDFTLDLTLP
jgi:hypothetical protein